MTKPGVYLTTPSWDILKFPPANLPPTLPPPTGERTFRAPFGISPWLFNVAMHPVVPFAFAAIYLLTVLNLNAYNRARGNKPWWISQQKFFKLFVVVHNVALVLFSLATFLAMFRAISHTLPSPNNSAGSAGIADALCKLHGPRGLGDAVTFNSTLNIWQSKNQLIRTAHAGTPDTTDVGRLWNEGLAFWGWTFYLSKFYEVLDTFIIVAKGKRSPTLQIYHHAGAMLCMWAGIRYMSPPIWMFVFVNSFIHTLMYVYYTFSALDIKVSETAKRGLTTLQIAQFIFGATYAGLHLFIAYDIPVATPYKVAAKVAAATSSASSVYSSAASAVSSFVATPTIDSSFGLFVKKLLLRAAGEEGVAERLAYPAVTDKPIAEVIESRLDEVRERVFHQPTYETKWRTEITRINCIDTSGEAFAIWLNLLYLFPLTLLFARFFIRSYITRSEKPKNVKEAAKSIKEDAQIAEAETERAVERAGKLAEDAVRDGTAEVKKEAKSLHDQLAEDLRKLRKGEYTTPKLNERVEKFNKQVKDLTEKAKQQLKQATDSTKAKAKQQADQASDSISSTADKAKQQLKQTADSTKEKAKQQLDQTADSIASSSEKAKQQLKQTADSTKEKTKQQLEQSTESIGSAKDSNGAESSDENGGDDKENQTPSASHATQTPDKKKKKKNKNKNKNTHDTASAATHGNVPAQDESEAKQDSNLAATEPTRPGTTDAIDNDTDAMGKSGVGIDLSKSASEAS